MKPIIVFLSIMAISLFLLACGMELQNRLEQIERERNIYSQQLIQCEKHEMKVQCPVQVKINLL